MKAVSGEGLLQSHIVRVVYYVNGDLPVTAGLTVSDTHTHCQSLNFKTTNLPP